MAECLSCRVSGFSFWVAEWVGSVTEWPSNPVIERWQIEWSSDRVARNGWLSIEWLSGQVKQSRVVLYDCKFQCRIAYHHLKLTLKYYFWMRNLFGGNILGLWSRTTDRWAYHKDRAAPRWCLCLLQVSVYIVITKYLFRNLLVSDRREELKQNFGSSVCLKLLISGGSACRCGVRCGTKKWRWSSSSSASSSRWSSS